LVRANPSTCRNLSGPIRPTLGLARSGISANLTPDEFDHLSTFL
jgi:hypothetical protein